MTIKLPMMATINIAIKTVDQVNMCHSEMLCDGSGRAYTQSCNWSLAIVRLDIVKSVDFKIFPKISKSVEELWRSNCFTEWSNCTVSTMIVQLRNRLSSILLISVCKLNKCNINIYWEIILYSVPYIRSKFLFWSATVRSQLFLVHVPGDSYRCITTRIANFTTK